MREGQRPVHVEEYVAHDPMKLGRPSCHAYVRVKVAKWVRVCCVTVGINWPCRLVFRVSREK
jgi:hypothetical protein